ncbi:hypothetical protein PoB_005616200 [Plakobranchus ocellatus]|uniref:Uncharacterized protein n=1 Tax=Plakobranchus ocellatus TaxID=259542 RepID=A0AAV4CEL2_9GAST|nr:hypothetical protein PoB_005616200 [Plakobranchus ocellatus]
MTGSGCSTRLFTQSTFMMAALREKKKNTQRGIPLKPVLNSSPTDGQVDPRNAQHHTNRIDRFVKLLSYPQCVKEETPSPTNPLHSAHLFISILLTLVIYRPFI